VRSFTTREFLAVDDFESYDDVIETETTIRQTWIDGLTTEASGVSHPAFPSPLDACDADRLGFCLILPRLVKYNATVYRVIGVSSNRKMNSPTRGGIGMIDGTLIP
jgi:hypothetical protein